VIPIWICLTKACWKKCCQPAREIDTHMLFGRTNARYLEGKYFLGANRSKKYKLKKVY